MLGKIFRSFRKEDASTEVSQQGQPPSKYNLYDSESTESDPHGFNGHANFEVNGEHVGSEHEKKIMQEIGHMDEDQTSSNVEGYAKFSEKDILAILPGTEDDDDMPASTLRMWILAVVFGAVVAGVDAFFGMRFPTVSISVVVILMVTWPLGQLMHFLLPDWTLPLPWGMSIALNPGPFNYKEHGCIFIFTNSVTSAGIVNNMIIEDTKFFRVNTGIGRQISINLSSYIISLSSIGSTRDILVTPEDRIWPGMLSRIASFKTSYSRDNPVANGWKMSRWVFFVIVFSCSFVWYWVPDSLMPFMSTIGAWISWIRPNSATLSQVFGVKTGLGLFPLTFDWTQITSINNPLTTPFWAVFSMFMSFVFWIWIVMPGLYYQNHFDTAHLPIMTNSVYTVEKKQYDFSKVVNRDWSLNHAKFAKYSPAILPIAFLMNLCLGLAVFASVVVHFASLFHEEVIIPWRNRQVHDDSFNRMSQRFKPFPLWVYLITLAIGLGLGFAFSEGWDNSPIHAGGFIVAIIIGSVSFVPSSLVEARANTAIAIDSFFYIVGANWFKGNPLHLMYFYNIGFGTIQHAMHMAQGAKVGHYLRIKPKIYMVVLFFSGIWASLVSPAVCWYLLNHFDGICTENAENNMICRKQNTLFNTQGIWGLFGSHSFAPGGRYVWVSWFFLVGGAVPIVHFIILKWKPSSLLAKFDPVLFFGGAELIPSVTGYNFSTWFATAFVFNFVIHKKFTAWWRKYNLVTSIGLDCGVAITIILVYFGVVYTGASKHLQWWGSKVASKGCDAKGCPHLNGPIPRPTGY